MGIGGHLQSSAIGYLSRQFGSGMDYVTRVRIVLPKKGKIVDVTAENNYDLFYAILGGGPGSWGIVTEYEFTPLYDDDYPNSRLFIYTWRFDLNETMDARKRLFKEWAKSTYVPHATNPLIFMRSIQIGAIPN